MPTPKAGEAPLYTGTVDCVKKTIKLEGFRGLYKGESSSINIYEWSLCSREAKYTNASGISSVPNDRS